MKEVIIPGALLALFHLVPEALHNHHMQICLSYRPSTDLRICMYSA
jgi:hypothetical protein